MAEPSLFERLFLEADEAPPDITEDTSPPDITEPPPDDSNEDIVMEPPPDIEAGTDETELDFSEEDSSTDETESKDVTVNEKISAIMNRTLFQKFLSLLNTIAVQVSSIKSNSDILFSISEDVVSVLKDLEKLDENIRLYLADQFEEENYSSNLFYFNKCVSMLSLLNENMDNVVSKAGKAGGDATSK